MPGSRKFQPKWPVSIVFILLFVALTGLGLWQLDRAAQKEAAHADYVKKKNLPEQDFTLLNIEENVEENIWRRTRVRGKYLQAPQILLDNQVMNGRPGYLVYSPLKIPSRDELVIINRGWVAASPYRDQLPELTTPAEELVLTGTLKLPPVTGVLLDTRILEPMTDHIVRMQTLSLGHLESFLDRDVSPVIIRLDGDSHPTLLRVWSEPGSGKARHQGYAFQWFALAATLLMLYIFLNMKQKAAEDDG